MHYILKISNKAFVIYKNDSIEVVQKPEHATQFARIGDAMEIASQINKDWESNIVKLIKIG